MSEIRSIGFIGAGNMGGPVCRRLATGGFDVAVFDPNPDAVAACVTAGARATGSAAEAALDADVVFTSLPLPEHVIATYGSLIDDLKAGTICVDISTVDPRTAREVATNLATADVDFVACPLGKGPAQAASGEIPLFVGGSHRVIEHLRPLLDRIGNACYYMGDVEAATTFKLVSNLIGMTNLAVLAEGYAIAAASGIEPQSFVAALKDTGAWSYQCDVRLESLIAEDHTPRFSVDLAAKDLRLALETAATFDVSSPVASVALNQLRMASGQGYGAEDATALSKVVVDGHSGVESVTVTSL